MFLELIHLFWMFFKIGLFTFGGGYAMIPLIEESLVGGGYIEVNMLYDMIGVAESTPGPIAVNMATFIGTHQLGLLGALAATLGVILPSFIIILLIAWLGSKVLESEIAEHAFMGLKPAVIGLIASVAVALAIRLILPNIDFHAFQFDFSDFKWRNLVILTVIISFIAFYKKKSSPALIIGISAVLGIAIYYIF